MDNISVSVVPVVSTADTNTPLVKNNKILNDLSIWSSAESGYFTTPGSVDNSITNVHINVNLSSGKSKITANPHETPKCRDSTRPRKRASSLTDMIDSHLNETTCFLPDFDSAFIQSNKQLEKDDDFCRITHKNDQNMELYCHRKRYCRKEINSQWTLMTLTEEQNNMSKIENEVDGSSLYMESSDLSNTQAENDYFKNDFIMLETLQNKCYSLKENLLESKSCPVTPVKQNNPKYISSPSEKNSFVELVVPHFYSPIFCEQTQHQSEDILYKTENNNSRKSPNKRLYASAESEKNDILYHNRPITPPKSNTSSNITTPNKHKSKKNSLSAKINLDFIRFGNIDIIDKLAELDLVWAVLKFLSGDDLCRFCMVSKRWRDVCLKDSRASRRRSKYLLEKRLDKENYISVIKKNTSENNEIMMNPMKHANSRKELLEIQNSNDKRITCTVIHNSNNSDNNYCNVTKSPPVSPKRATLLKFVKAGKKLGPQKCLKKCPKCSGPAHPLSRKLHKFGDLNYYDQQYTQEINDSKISEDSFNSSLRNLRKEKDISNKVETNMLNYSKNKGFNYFAEFASWNNTPCTEKNSTGNIIQGSIASKTDIENKFEHNPSSTLSIDRNSSIDTIYNSNCNSSNKNIFFEQKSSDTKKKYLKELNDDANNIEHMLGKSGISSMLCDENINNCGKQQNGEYCCDSLRCGYTFCVLCLGPTHFNGICPQSESRLQAYSPPRLPHEQENCRNNSKKIKKSLRRLL